MGSRLRLALSSTCIVALGMGFWYFTRASGWGSLGAPTRLSSLGADVFFLNVPEIVRRGPPRLVVVRFDQPVELVPHHYNSDNLSGPKVVEDWAQLLGAPVVFNAGQFDENFQYMGWLKGRGTWLNEQRKPAWMGLLVSTPMQGGPWAQIVDLQNSDPNIADRYFNVVQSMMLVDDGARVRVRQTDLAACRTLVAEDQQGRILVIATEGATTLHDLASWLPNSGLGIVRAMNLDGGIESQLAINTPDLTLTFYGQYGTDSTVFEARQLVRYPLPAVIAVRPMPKL